MALLDRRTASVLLTILVFVAVLLFVWLARLPVITLIFAIFFAQLLEPAVRRAESWLGVSRGKAVAAIYLAIIAGLLIFGLTVGPPIVHQIQRLSSTLPSLLMDVTSGEIAWQVGARQGWSAETQVWLHRWLIQNQSLIVGYVHDITVRIEELGAHALWIFLVPVLAVFFLKDRARLRASVIEAVGAYRNRALLENIIDDLDTMLGAFVRAQLLLSFFGLIAYGTFLLIARLPYALGVAAIAGVLEFIPFVGPLLTLGILVSIALLTSYPHWIMLVCFWVIWRFIQDYVNIPRVMGHGLDLHPMLAILAVLVGGEVAGVLGIFLSIPTVAALRILWVNWTTRPGVRTAA